MKIVESAIKITRIALGGLKKSIVVLKTPKKKLQGLWFVALGRVQKMSILLQDKIRC